MGLSDVPLRCPQFPVGDPSGPIPPLLHHIWVGSPVPSWVARSWDRQDAALPSLESRRWDDEAVAGNRLLAASAALADGYRLRPVGKSDLVRAALGALYGGVYLDSDIVVLGDVSELSGQGAWVATNPGTGRTVADTGCWGMPQGHPAFALVLEASVEAMERGVRNTHFVAGPRPWRRALDAHEVPLVRTLTMGCSEGERWDMAFGDPDVASLRAKRPGYLLAHIGVGGLFS